MSREDLLVEFRKIQAKISSLSRYDREMIIDTVEREFKAGHIPPQTEEHRLILAKAMVEKLKKMNKFAEEHPSLVLQPFAVRRK